ncbi:MAG: hypothetical protein M1822_006484 [Bathelium mastoideum]|nr:MAG: hypothetical protein M1822_006484 [Bathelium mastoideum]
MADSIALPNDIADCVLRTFDGLPANRKPRERDGKSREWVPLSGIVLSKSTLRIRFLLCFNAESTRKTTFPCNASHSGKSLGNCLFYPAEQANWTNSTGMKCLPSYKLPHAHGNVLHDWHAEIIAIRAFNQFLIQECANISILGLSSSHYVQMRDQDAQTPAENQSFEVGADVGIHMYCSEAPCGDASMELTIAAQDDATPWSAQLLAAHIDAEQSNDLLGRGYFSELGVVRRKPSRSDAPITLSKSCTDKLTLKQCTSMLSSTTSLLIHPGNAYLSSLVLPASQHVPTATNRAFGATGRMRNIKAGESWPGGYSFCPFRVEATDREFTYSRRGATSGQDLVPSNLSVVWTPSWQETLIGGVIQGRKLGDMKGASRISRRGIWRAVAEIVDAIGTPALRSAVGATTYNALKNAEILKERMAVKDEVKREALKGWMRNEGDDKFESRGI